MDFTRDVLRARARAALAQARAAENRQAVGFLEEARDALTLLGHDRDSGDWAECHGRLGYLYVELERFDDAVEALSIALADTDTHRMAAEHFVCARWLGRAYAGSGRHAAAELVLSAAHRRATEAHDDEELARCAETFAEVLAAAGELGRSGRFWLQAADIHLRLGDDFGAARCAEALCLSGAVVSDYADVVGLLGALKERFALGGLREHVAECDLWIGMTSSAYGGLPQAEAAFTEAAAECGRLLETEPAQASGHVVAVLRAARVALADLHMRRGDFPGALQLLRMVVAVDTDAHVWEVAHVRIMQAQCAIALGDAPGARDLLVSTRTLLAGRADMPTQILDTNCREYLGLIALNLGNRADALATLSDARASYGVLGANVRAASVDALMGSAMLRPVGPDRPAGGDARRALELLVPAFLYLDGLRFQFRGTADRAAWKAQSAWVLRESLEAATALMESSDADTVRSGTRMVAELVETLINSGIHSEAGARADAITHTAHLARSFGGPTGPTRAPDTLTVRGPGSSGASRLLDHLPMRPPPQLLMPDQTVALQHYHRLRAENYPHTVDIPTEVCRTW
ncbi:hypothetical protein [Mycolicibacterium llatzerense]|uniref:hypothetical protein n=1 Tax=Mycolicibacterium llatzerense TaxID=280871 RepID=UPI0008DD460D|nr:hypothetical protein [Mycolicibacterium llatzerense]